MLNKRMSELARNLGLVLFSCLVSLGFAEMVCRVIPLSNDSDPTYKLPHAVLPYVMQPGSESRSLHGHPIRINSLGLRDAEYGHAKREGVIRVLVLGDSSTFAYGNRVEDGYTKVLESLLNDAQGSTGREIEVINTGHPGFNTRDEYNFMQLYGLEYSPDLIVVGVMTNDFTQPSLELTIRDGVASAPGSFWMSIPTWVKRMLRTSHLYMAVGWARANGGLALRATPAPAYSDADLSAKLREAADAFGDILALASTRGLPVVFVSIPNRYETVSRTYLFPPFYAQLREMQVPGKVIFVDMLRAFSNYSGRPDEIFAFRDSSHPNATGHRLLAETLLEPVSALVPQAYPGAVGKTNSKVAAAIRPEL